MNSANVARLVADVSYHVFAAAAGSAPTTVARIVTRSGWSITASSTPARADGFDPAIGERQALDHALRELLALERYRRRSVEAAP